MPQINISITLNQGLYIKDPLTSDLGKRIVYHAIELFDEVGYLRFNFKRLSAAVGSPEASIYRYFENKYKLLAYLVSWYWDYMHYMVILDTRNIDDPVGCLERAVYSLTCNLHQNEVPAYINQEILHQVVVAFSSKVYHHYLVDELKEKGFYQNYMKLVYRVSGLVKACNKDYPYPKTLATSIIEQSLSSEYNLKHFPELTDHGKKVKEGLAARELVYKSVIYQAKKLIAVES